ncbi:HesA/MoeB/ThiF family protein [Sphaerisporangium aureirubrum]|uniref:HesA/MoeB/ThiF family protein n=1 Tax=Sphaerisporangium aureirubrum TaxID=1544736 RepID=A0ABW1NMJ6_9ACTN
MTMARRETIAEDGTAGGGPMNVARQEAAPEDGTAGEAPQRPRIKPEHRAYRTTEGNVRIGGVVYGIGAEIADPGGWVWTLAEAMDGTRSPAEIRAEVVRAHPELPEHAVRQAMADLQAAGYVDDAAPAASPEPSARERSRYDRGVALLRWMDRTPRTDPWQAQDLLRRARVLLVGIGGTGGFAAQSLVASGVGHLHCVDPDVVELSNLNRQPLFREPDLGRPKTDAALSSLRSLNSDVTVTAARHTVRSPACFHALLTTPPAGTAPPGVRDLPVYDLLVLAADRPAEIRAWANEVCLELGVPWVDGGYQGPLVSAGVHVPGRGACWECLRAGEAERRETGQADGDAGAPIPTSSPAGAVTAGMSGLLLAHAALALLTGVPPMEPGFRFGLNLMLPGDPVLERHPRRPDCPACGDTRPTGVPSGGAS